MLGKILTLAAITITQTVSCASFTLPLTRKPVTPGSRYILPPPPHPYFRHQRISKAFEFSYQGFWFANFTIGTSSALELLIDTGSSDVFLNPGIYHPSPASTNLNETFNIEFATTNSDGSGTETLFGNTYKDLVSLDGTLLSVPSQALGLPTTPPTPCFPLDGLIGFAGTLGDVLNQSTWFPNLCTQGLVTECRFGLALSPDGTGTQYLGAIQPSLFIGPLSTTSLYYLHHYNTYLQWYAFGDIAINGEIIKRDALMVFDSGTTVIFGPIAEVKTIFDAAGIQSILTPNTTTDTHSTLTGYYPCSDPPALGFGFPSLTNASTARTQNSGNSSHHSTIFEVLEEPLAFAKEGNNCTCSLFGTDEFGALWLVGQAFFQGRYIDHDVTGNTIGFANLI